MIAYDPFSPEAMRDPYPAYRALREQAPVYALPDYDAYALSRFADVWEAISNADALSVAEGPVFDRRAVSKPFSGRAPSLEASFATCDPPLHTAIRGALRAHFTPAAVARLERDVRVLARQQLDALVPAGRLDVARDYAAPVAVRVLCRVLGLDESDGPAVTELVNRSARREPGVPGMSADGAQAQRELHARVYQQVRRAADAGAGAAGVLAALLRGRVEGRALAPLDVATQLVTLLVGGVETLPKILAGAARELARAPAQRARLASDAGLAAGAFEEALRHQGVLQHVGRTALREVEIAGQRLRPGQRLFLLLQSANRDEREFPAADRFDIARRPPRHLALGHGPHHCIGAHLARLEGRVLLAELVSRLPDYEVDESGSERPASEFQLGYTALPVTFPVA